MANSLVDSWPTWFPDVPDHGFFEFSQGNAPWACQPGLLGLSSGMHPPSVFDALELAVGPVILVSACGLLLLTMTNRLGRAIDRSRLLVRETGGQRDVQLEILMHRARLIRSAILGTSSCILLTSFLVLTLFVSVFVPFRVGWTVAMLFCGSLVSLIASLGFFISDILLSLRAMELEIEGRN